MSIDEFTKDVWAALTLAEARTKRKECMNCGAKYPGAPTDPIRAHGWRLGGITSPFFLLLYFCPVCGPEYAPELFKD